MRVRKVSATQRKSGRGTVGTFSCRSQRTFIQLIVMVHWRTPGWCDDRVGPGTVCDGDRRVSLLENMIPLMSFRHCAEQWPYKRQ